MAAANGKPRGRPPHKNNTAAPSEPGDEQGAYTHAQLVRMDNRFRARLLRAHSRGARRTARPQPQRMMQTALKPVAPVRSVSHVIARATLYAKRCTTPSPRSLPCSSITNCLRKRSEEHTSELQSLRHLVCRLLLEKKTITRKQQCK